MSLGPLFRREFRAATIRRRPYLTRALFALWLGLVALGIGLIVFRTIPGMDSRQQVALFGRSTFIATIVCELMFLVIFVPNRVGGAVAEEREKDTLPYLLLSRLTPVEIVATKAVARWLPASDPLVVGLPALVASGWLAGFESQIWLASLVLLSSSGLMAALAVLASSRRDQVATARASAMVWCFGWLLVPPVVSIIPVSPGSLSGDLLAELKSLCALVAPSSPLSLVTDAGWYNKRPGALDLPGRVALMIGLQALMATVAIGLASGRLKAREVNPNWLDPTRGYRPPCGDDPIFWREFELPTRRGAGPLIWLRIRYLWVAIRGVLNSLLALIGVLLTLAVPVGLVLATIYYGSAAFGEVWEQGYGPRGAFDERIRFNNLIRGATGMLALLPASWAASIVAMRVSMERDKKTWDIFLTTPLGGEEVVRSKARVALQGFWQAAWPLPILWGLGLACGSVSAPGVILAAVDLAAVLWAGVALGFCLGLRPGPTIVISNRTSWVLLALITAHGPLLWAALASSWELALWAERWRIALLVATLVVPTLTAGVAWWATRQTRRRFDEWMGRPIRSARINQA